MNPCDQAQDVELAEWERRQRAAIAPEPAAPSARECLDCGLPIPEPRRAASRGARAAPSARPILSTAKNKGDTVVIQLELWHLILLFLSCLGSAGGFGKILLAQIEKRLMERFKALEDDSRKLADEAKKALDVERQLLTLRAELPLQYVRREDYVRNQTVIEAKLDAVALRIENWQLKKGTA